MDLTVALPPKIVEKIFSYLQLKDLLACSEVCVGWYRLANNVSLWEPFVSNIENSWVSHSELRECDAITSNFLDDSQGLKSIFQFKPLSALNPCKMFIRQRNFLKHNWVNGIYTEHCIQPKDFGLTKFSQVKVEYPSKIAQDCLYYPILGTRKNGEEGLYLVRLDENPRIVHKLIETMDKKVEFHAACVMRDCMVWILGGTVQFFDLSSQLEDSEVQTIGEIGEKYWNLTMNVDYIVVWCEQSLYIWCKKTLDLKLSRKYQPDQVSALHRVCLSNELLITCVRFVESGYTIETHSTKSNFESKFLRKFDTDIFKIIKSSKKSIIVGVFSRDRAENQVYVLDNKTLSKKFSQPITALGKLEVIDNLVLIYDGGICIPDFKEMMKLNILTGECTQQGVSAIAFQHSFVFDNILVTENYNSDSIEVWDWRKNMKLLHFNAENHVLYVPISEDDDSDFDDIDETDGCAFILAMKRLSSAKKLTFHVSEARLVTLDWDSQLKVYGFG
ncbi:hypothetical protein LSTR_LSTR004063 [Laodelphax striatellus]|uniref:F-box domain-containing protein n=1 Tax=Laodelphax striatellus TaxID=195883 RepID=A0A482WFT0_LAOST|nr:hypothetical protein LSTR_LSTR004063 [Laodelphax striatellus]